MPNAPLKVVTFVLAAIVRMCQPSFACDSPSCTCSTAAHVSTSRQGAWHIAATANFQVCSLTSSAEAEIAAHRCEQVREVLTETWELAENDQPWSPKCQVILHRTMRDYGAVVGAAYASTFGSSLVKPTTGTITVRRIDLRVNVDDYLTAALPHELCHVLLADRFRNQPAPLWYDEGIALLADTEAKQRLHEQDLHDGIRRKAEYSIAELIVADEYPPSERMGIFYGQCAGLTRHLRQQGSAEQLHRFAIRCGEVGVNLAAQECYAFAGVRDMEQNWRKTLIEGDRPTMAGVLPMKSSGLPLRQLAATRFP